MNGRTMAAGRSAILFLTVACALAACSFGGVKLGPKSIEGKSPSAFIEMHEVQAAYIGSGAGGGGTLFFDGREYPFGLGAAGIGGIGLSTVDASGDVYNLTRVDQFPGTYGQARYGFAIGTESGGDLWLQNEQGVILHLKAKRTGLMLTLGGDAVVISFNAK
jgi:hypothetical protein